MSDTSSTSVVASSPKAKPGPKPKGKRAMKTESKPNHPPTSEMVIVAIKALNEKKGSSLIAIKKYISENYQIDAGKMNFFIKKSLKAAVADGVLECKATNMTGSFRLTRKEKFRSEKEEGKVAKPKPVKVATKQPTTGKGKRGVGRPRKDQSGAAAKAKTSKQKATKASKAVSTKVPKAKKLTTLKKAKA
uniref:Putative histone h1 n=1 Tax=Tabanus bromius TaxID=304241 RepID=A0A0K8TLT5_TABBR